MRNISSKFFLALALLWVGGLYAQNTYFGPTSPPVGDPQLVRVQVMVYDSAEADGLQIQEAVFNGQSIPLKPRGIYGIRGQGTFQVPPGAYKLSWIVKRDKFVWPRTVSHEEIVTISPRDLWLQIEIHGDTATIN